MNYILFSKPYFVACENLNPLIKSDMFMEQSSIHFLNSTGCFDLSYFTFFPWYCFHFQRSRKAGGIIAYIECIRKMTRKWTEDCANTELFCQNQGVAGEKSCLEIVSMEKQHKSWESEFVHLV